MAKSIKNPLSENCLLKTEKENKMFTKKIVFATVPSPWDVQESLEG